MPMTMDIAGCVCSKPYDSTLDRIASARRSNSNNLTEKQADNYNNSYK